MAKNKVGSVTLLKTKHFSQINPWGEPVIGWLPASQGVGGLVNPQGFAMLRVVVQKLIDGIMEPMYDQPLIIEGHNVVVIATTNDGKIALVRNFRMTGKHLMTTTNYIHQLQKECRWEELLETLGQWNWEAPRGLISTDESKRNEELSEIIIKSAKVEALEEAGLTLTNTEIVGQVNVNTTFFAHPQYVVKAQIESVGKAQPENFEIVGKMKLFSTKELKKLNQEGSFVDGFALAALALCGIPL